MSTSKAKVAIHLVACLLIVCCHGGFQTNISQAEQWPQFRGPGTAGVSTETGFPARWTKSDYAWQVTIPGEGHSSPVIWEEYLFVGTAQDTGSQRGIVCLNSATGQTLWTKFKPFRANRKHDKNSYYSASPVTDGERVYSLAADDQRYSITAYSVTGELAWEVDLPGFAGQHGQGASPVIYRNLLVVPNDQDGPSSIMAFDCATGKPVWTTPRASREASYATPALWQPQGANDFQLLCVNGATGITSLNPLTGKLNWQSAVLPQRTVASAVVGQGLVYAHCGQGGKGTLLLGVDPSTATSDRPPVEKLRKDKQLPYVPCLVADGPYLYLWGDGGIVSCFEPAADKILWSERVGGKFSGSPIVVDGKLFCIDEEGQVVALKTGPKYELLGKNPLGETSHSTPAVANGRLYFRSIHQLACIEGTSPTKP